MNAIKIGKPYIKHDDVTCRLCADITCDKCSRTLYYEVSIKYKDYLNIVNSDTFVLGLLHNAMYEGKDIICEGSVSSRLLFQLNNYYIPVIGNEMPDLKCIRVIAYQTSSNNIGVNSFSRCVMTGCSGGVDSFYTMLKYKMLAETDYNITHVLFNNISTADNNADRIRNIFDKDVKEKEEIANSIGVIPIFLYTNLYEFYKSQFIYNYYFSSQYISAAYALGKLVTVYYFSSGVSVADFSIDHSKIKDCAYFDLFSLNCFSSDYLSVYSAGSEVSRFEKTKYISNYDVVKKHLQVCSEEQYTHFYEQNPKRTLNTLNCGYCGKCRRTIVTLYSLNCLSDYELLFDLSYFKKNKERFIAKELEYDSKAFTEELKKNLVNFKFGNSFYFYRLLYAIIYTCRHHLRKYIFLKKIFNYIKRINKK